jgi:hypothetical protein
MPLSIAAHWLSYAFKILNHVPKALDTTYPKYAHEYIKMAYLEIGSLEHKYIIKEALNGLRPL